MTVGKFQFDAGSVICVLSIVWTSGAVDGTVNQPEVDDLTTDELWLLTY